MGNKYKYVEGWDQLGTVINRTHCNDQQTKYFKTMSNAFGSLLIIPSSFYYFQSDSSGPIVSYDKNNLAKIKHRSCIIEVW